MSYSNAPSRNWTVGASGSAQGTKASVYSTAHNKLTAVNVRSCISCRNRKIRCAKVQPCSNCVKAGVECKFPSSKRNSRSGATEQNAELIARLKYLEGIIEQLERPINIEAQGRKKAPEPHFVDNDHDGARKETPLWNKDSCVSSQAACGEEHGRLIVNEGRHQYLSQSFWAIASGNVIEIADIYNPVLIRSEDEMLHPGLLCDSSFCGYDFLFDTFLSSNDTNGLGQHQAQSLVLLLIYEDNCDPVLKIIHRPTVRNIFFKAASNNDTLSESEEALASSVRYGAVCSLSKEQCLEQFGLERDKLVTQLRHATERALRSARFLQSPCLTTLQAFAIYLWVLRSYDDIRLVWSLSGLAVHLARSLGMHRDGTNIQLSPFETEMRRRLWWHLCLLDARSAEDQGIEPSFSESFYDAQLPLNINDDDISVNTRSAPSERIGTTEMTFCLVRFELSREKRKMTLEHLGACRGDSNASQQSITKTKRYIDQVRQRVRAKYLDYCDTTVPIDLATNLIGRIVLAKLLFVASNSSRHLKDDSQDYLTSEFRDELFEIALEQMELSTTLQLDERLRKWSWLFCTYIQWHAMTFLLLELCERPRRAGHERAWKTIEYYRERLVSHGPTGRRGLLWDPLQKLMRKAQASRLGQNNGLHDQLFPEGGLDLQHNGKISDKDPDTRTPLASDRTAVEVPSCTVDENFDVHADAESATPSWESACFNIDDITISAQDFDLRLPEIGLDGWKS